ncbi:hypothetical protein RNZ50_00780 [Paracoccaceae bacterium Fryx2]|nr:hypothetical protein [Paracoccaceae bacterium Fryx2]
MPLSSRAEPGQGGPALGRAFAAAAAAAADPWLARHLGPVLARYALDGGCGVSGLNHDGSPLQLCLGLRADRAGWRVILDPALGPGPAQLRHDRARRALARDLAAQGAAGAWPEFDRLLADCGPDAALPAADFAHGAFWVGAEIGGPGRAIYVDAAARPAAEGWARAATAFRACAAAEGEIGPTLAALADVAVPSSVGIEVRGGQRRLKLHCRLRAAPPQGALAAALPMLADSRLLSAVAALMQGGPGLSLHGFVIEAAFDAETGLLGDAKLDLAMPELWPPAVALHRSRAAAAALGVNWPDTSVARLSGFARLSYVGIGRGADGQTRLNLYFKPAPPP